MEYHILIDEIQKGPFSEEELRGKVGKGELNGSELIWHAGLADWQPLNANLPPAAAPQDIPVAPPPLPTQHAWLHDRKTIVPLVAVSTLFCFPVGIALVFLSKAFRRRTKIILASIGPALLLGLIVLALIGMGIQANAFAKDREGIMAATQSAIAKGDTTTLAKIIANYGAVTDAEFVPLLKQAKAMVGEEKAKRDGPAILEAKLKKLFGERLQRFAANEIYSMPGKYNVEVRFKGSFPSKNLIERDMAKAYRVIYEASPISVHEAWMFAYMPLTDKYGKTAEELVYKTSLQSDDAVNINWTDMTLVDFPAIWKQLFISGAL